MLGRSTDISQRGAKMAETRFARRGLRVWLPCSGRTSGPTFQAEFLPCSCDQPRHFNCWIWINNSPAPS
jgi:hypothetical protein